MIEAGKAILGNSGSLLFSTRSAINKCSGDMLLTVGSGSAANGGSISVFAGSLSRQGIIPK